MPRIVPSQVVEVIDRVFPFLKDQIDSKDNRISLDRGFQTELEAIVSLVDQISQELLIVDQNDFTLLQLSITTIKSTIPIWQVRNHAIKHIRGYGDLNPVTIIRNVLSKCSDEGILESTPDLTFISNQELKDNLRIDISAANTAFNNGEWKAATVLSGATIEAALLYVLHQVHQSESGRISTIVETLVANKIFEHKPKNGLNRWNLHHLLEVAAEFDLIRAETAAQARISRNFRNLIHPGISERTGLVCNRATALSALAGLEHTINDLNKMT